MQTTNQRNCSEADDAEPDERARNAGPGDAPPQGHISSPVVAGPSNLIIRAAKPSDAAALTALSNLPGVRRGTLRLPFTTRAMIEARLQMPGVHVLVAEREGAAIAQAFLGQQQGRRAHVGAIGIFVHDDHVGSGVGRALMDALLDLADNWIELSVNVDNASAIRLYERLGFMREGTRRGDSLRDGVSVDSYVVARPRDAPPPSLRGPSVQNHDDPLPR